MQIAYQLGKSVGKIIIKLEEAVESIQSSSETQKMKYQFVMETMVEILLSLEDSKLSQPTLEDMTEEIERLVEIYGELKYDKTLPKGQRIIGGLKQKFSLLRQSRKTLRNEDVKTLFNKIQIWDDRINIALQTS